MPPPPTRDAGADLTVEVKGATELQAAFERVARECPQAIARAHFRIAGIIRPEAKLNCPRSPKREELDALRNTDRKVKRKPRAHSRPSPGGLIRSIDSASNSAGAAVYVAANSEAGKYARKMHDDKGVSWFKRGPGTVARGARADAKFISRAIDENQTQIRVIIDSELDKAMHL